ncbi:MAG: amidohydrolase family protein, partial [Bacillota bacterium]
QRGVTCTADMLEGANVVEEGIDRVAEAFREAGIRGYLAFESSERVSKEHGEKGLQKNIDFARKWNSKDDLIKGTMAVHTAFSASPEYIKKTREAADELNTPLQIHIAQSPFEVEFIKENMGYPGPVYLLEDAGFLGSDVIAAHCIYLEEEEIDILAEHGVNISFNPKSNQRAANGVCPVPEFKKRGMNVGLGLDGINIMDMHEMMVHAAYMIRTANLDRNLLPPREVLEMATVNGARALGIEDEVGSLEEGKKADIIFVQMEGREHLTPIFDIWEAAAFGARGSDVKMVMVDGEIVVEDNKIKNVAVNELLQEVRQAATEFKEKILSTPVAADWELTTINKQEE